MTTYFVRTNGNDTSGTGSTDTPWASLKKALATIGIEGGHTIKMGAGTYSENDAGCCQYKRTFLATVTIEPENIGDVVIVTGASSAAYNLLVNGPATNYLTKNIIFRSRTGTPYPLSISANNNTVAAIEFQDCVFDADPTYGGSQCAVFDPYNTSTITATFTRCQFINFNPNANVNPIIDLRNPNPATQTVTLNLNNCNLNSDIRVGLWVDGATVNINGGTYTNIATTGVPIKYGQDGATGDATGGYIKNAIVTSTGNHGLLIGAGATNVEVSGCTLEAAGHALVLKACTSPNVHDNTIRGTANGFLTILLKGVTGAIVQFNNIFHTATGGCFGNYDGDVAYKSQNCNVSYNHCLSNPSGYLIYWHTSGDNGGNVVDYNWYRSNPNFGDVLGNLNIASLPALLSAWNGYGDGSNDSHSSLWINNMLSTGLCMTGRKRLIISR